MSNRTAALRIDTTAVWIAIASLVVALLLPILTATQRVEAAQILDRYIHMNSSAISVETDYDVEFQIPNGATIGSLRVEFCNESPLPGTDCTVSTVSGTNVPDLDASAGSIVTLSAFQFGTAGASPGVAGTDNTSGCTTEALTAPSAGDTHLDIDCSGSGTETITAGVNDYVFFTLNDVNNPSNAANDSFYARIYTFAATTPTAYVDTAPPLGNFEGGVALSTAEQITVEARVQETLTFTVGVDGATDDCAAPAGSAVELGVLSTGGINLASTDGFNQITPNTDVACAEVTTNASNGVSVYYVGDNLSVGATSCPDVDTDVDQTPVITDQCINRDIDASANVINAGTEQWGLGVSASVEYGTITSTMTATGPYDIGAADEYSFTPNAVTLIASSAGVLDQAVIEVDMAATASITTPTGVYDTTLTFIATAQF